MLHEGLAKSCHVQGITSFGVILIFLERIAVNKVNHRLLLQFRSLLTKSWSEVSPAFFTGDGLPQHICSTDVNIFQKQFLSQNLRCVTGIFKLFLLDRASRETWVYQCAELKCVYFSVYLQVAISERTWVLLGQELK